MWKLLIADDHTLVRQGLRRIIEEVPGYEVVGEVGDGLKVIPLIQKIRPDMLILDISMPGIGGIELIRRIRKTDKKVMILVLTMHKNEEYLSESLRNGAQGYVLKDNADKELFSAIEAIRKKKIYISSSFPTEVVNNLVYKKRNKTYQSPKNILTVHERKVLRLTVEGNSKKRAADRLGISVRTVGNHIRNIMHKTGVSNVANLVKYAIKNGLAE